MQTYELEVRDRTVHAASPDTTMVRTSAGIDQIAVRLYGAEWLDFDLSLALSVGGAVYETPVTPEAPTGGDWDAGFTVPVPDAALMVEGAMGVCVHGTDSDGNHIITARAYPLHVEAEGDEI